MITKPYGALRVGEVAITEPRTITEAYVRHFAESTGDRHPVHLDPDYAVKSRFGSRIAHGALMLSTLIGLADNDPCYVECFYGIGTVKFRAPTYFGDIVHGESQVLEVRPRADGQSAIVVVDASLVNQDGVKILTGSLSFLVAADVLPAALE